MIQSMGPEQSRQSHLQDIWRRAGPGMQSSCPEWVGLEPGGLGVAGPLVGISKLHVGGRWQGVVHAQLWLGQEEATASSREDVGC